MTQLLVSVRSVDECATALRFAVDVIDIKEPTRGSLGAADPDTIRQLVAAIQRRRPVSIALGELLDFNARRFAEMPAVDFVKLGLAGCAARPQWPQLWRAAWQQLPQAVHRVAVAYADSTVACSPGWSDVLRSARECCCSVLLLDTFDKTAGGLLDWLNLEQLRQVRHATRACGMQLALAGSLTRPQIVELLPLQPDFVAVRAAVCRGGRQALLDGACIGQIVDDLAEFRTAKTS